MSTDVYFDKANLYECTDAVRDKKYALVSLSLH